MCVYVTINAATKEPLELPRTATQWSQYVVSRDGEWYVTSVQGVTTLSELRRFAAGMSIDEGYVPRLNAKGKIRLVSNAPITDKAIFLYVPSLSIATAILAEEEA